MVPKKCAVLLLAVLLLGVGAANAANTGKIMGRVVNAADGSPLLGANVIIEGTTLGASTDLDGNFFILNVPPGKYSIKASVIGFTPMVIQDVVVNTDRTTKLDFELEETVVKTEEVIYKVAKRPMIRKDMTDSRTTRTAEDMQMMPVDNISDIVKLTAGTVGSNFRGGRASEVNYIVDGVSMVDPMTGTYEGFIPQIAFEEVNIITGGQSVEYGNALSGVVNQITKEGTEQFGGNLSLRTDDFGNTNEDALFGSHDQMKDMQGSISGPVPFYDKMKIGNLFYLFSAQYYDTRGRFDHDDSTLTSVFGKLTYKFTAKHKLTFSANVSNAQYSFFSNAWRKTTYEDKLDQYQRSMVTDPDNPDATIPDPDYNFFSRNENGDLILDENGDPIPWYGNGLLDTEDLNHNGVIDEGEDLNGDGIVNTEDLDHNFQLGSHNMLNHLPFYNHHTEQFSVKWNHTISNRTFYELSLSRYKTELRYNTREYFNEDTNGNGIFDLEWGPYSDPSEIPDEYLDDYQQHMGAKLDAQGNPEYFFIDYNDNGVWDYEDRNGNRIWDWGELGPRTDLFADKNDNGYIDASENGPRDQWLKWEDITFNANTKDNDEFYIYGDGTTYNRARWNYDYKTIWTVKGNVTSQVHKYHQLRSGVELQFMEIFDHDVDMASGGNVYGQNFKADPRLFGFWAEDKMEFEGMVINAGMRLDVFDINWNNYPADVTDPVVDPSQGGQVKNPVAIEPKYYWGPRLGVAFPITERDLLSFNYSKNFQIPILRYAFTNVNWDFSGAFPIVGNPNLEPERTTAYELTVRHQFTSDLAIVGTGFYKDITGLTDTRQVFYTTRNWYGLYINLDYGNVRGFELSLEKRFSNFYSGTINYTYSVAKGKASSARQNYENAWAGDLIRTTESYLDWDQRHTINGSLQFMIPKGTKPFGQPWLDEWLLSVIGRYGSGLPFSSPSKDKDPPINDQRLPYTLTFDARLQKRISFNDNIAAVVYVQGYNIFNKKNIDERFFQDNADTGWYMQNDANNDGRPDYDVDGRMNDPRFWERGRVLQLGLGLEF